MRQLIYVFCVVTCCFLSACTSQQENSLAHRTSVRHIKLEDPQIEFFLCWAELKKTPTLISDRWLVFGPDSLVTRVSPIGSGPFFPGFSVYFIMLEPDTISIDFRDLKASEKISARLFRGHLDEGYYTLGINYITRIPDLPNGIYLFQFTVDDTLASRKFAWIR